MIQILVVLLYGFSEINSFATDVFSASDMRSIFVRGHTPSKSELAEGKVWSCEIVDLNGDKNRKASHSEFCLQFYQASTATYDNAGTCRPNRYKQQREGLVGKLGEMERGVIRATDSGLLVGEWIHSDSRGAVQCLDEISVEGVGSLCQKWGPGTRCLGSTTIQEPWSGVTYEGCRHSDLRQARELVRSVSRASMYVSQYFVCRVRAED